MMTLKIGQSYIKDIYRMINDFFPSQNIGPVSR